MFVDLSFREKNLDSMTVKSLKKYHRKITFMSGFVQNICTAFTYTGRQRPCTTRRWTIEVEAVAAKVVRYHQSILDVTVCALRVLCFTPHFRQKWVSSASSLNTLYTAESAQFYSAFFANNDKFNSALSPKTQNLDYTFSPKLLKMIKKCTVMKLYSAYSATTLS